MRRHLIKYFACACAVAAMPAHGQKMAEVLRTIPNSILPLLSKNDRLDLVDEWQAGVKAEVKNKLGDTVTLTQLDDQQAVLRTSDLTVVTIKRVEALDTPYQFVEVTTAVTIDGKEEKHTKVYSYLPSTTD